MRHMAGPATPASHIYADTPCFHPAFLTSSAQHFPMPLYRATWTWSGFSGGPGYTNFHFLDPDPISQAGIDQTAARARTFWNAVKAFLPSTVTITEPTTFEEIDTGTGELLSENTWPGGAPLVGVLVGNYSAAVGACISWNTIGIVNGRKLRGRTFLVPLGSAAFDTAGTLKDADRTTMLNAANAFADASTGIDLAVWHRPQPNGSDGVAAGVTTANITDKTAVLRSRRD